jgi:hypothetical protein
VSSFEHAHVLSVHVERVRFRILHPPPGDEHGVVERVRRFRARFREVVKVVVEEEEDEEEEEGRMAEVEVVCDKTVVELEGMEASEMGRDTI